VLVLGTWLFQVPIRGSLLDIYLAAVLLVLANLALGLLISTRARSRFQAMQMTLFLFLPSILLSGFMFPFAGMPRPVQWLAEVLPLTHFLRLVRGIMLRGASLWSCGDALALLAFIVVMMTWRSCASANGWIEGRRSPGPAGAPTEDSFPPPPARAAVGQRFGDHHIHELADQSRRRREVHRTHVLGLAGQLVRVLARGPSTSTVCTVPTIFSEMPAACALMRSCRRDRRACFGIADRVLQVRGRRARAPRIDEGEAVVEADVLDQLHGLLEVGIGLAGEADDEVELIEMSGRTARSLRIFDLNSSAV
jgi:hypothetical protein